MAFNGPKYFVNNSDPDNPKIYLYTIINGKVGYYNSKSGAPISAENLGKATEKAFDQLPQNRLLPVTFPPVTVDNFEGQFKTYLGSYIIAPDRYYTKNDILEKINETFGKHVSFNIFNSIIKKIPVEETAPEQIDQQALLNVFPLDSDLFILINFFRSYVDLYHDILEKGNIYCEEFATNFKASLSAGPLLNMYNHFMTEITDRDSEFRIKTDSGKINQTRCKKFVEHLTDFFIDNLPKSISFIPKRKENATIMSASIDNDIEMDELFKTLKADGVDKFYVESANNKIGSKLVSNGFSLCDLTLGKWDAGSGYSGAAPIIVGPAGPIIVPNIPVDMFGLINVSVSPDNTKLVCALSGAPILEVNGPTKLSVNRIMTTVGGGIIRGSEDAEITPITTNPQITSASTSTQILSLVSLKTWTDLIQIITISNSQINKNGINPIKILTVIYDGLCETTARMFGLGPVLKTEGKIVTYYNYNLTSRTLNTAQIKIKSQLKKFILTDIAGGIVSDKSLLHEYVQDWFNQKIETLKVINSIFYDPIIYFVTKLFIQKYTEAYEKSINILSNIESTDIKLLPNYLDEYIESITGSASLLGDFFDYIKIFNDAINLVNNLTPRAKKGGSSELVLIFLNAYDTLQQQIVNTFGNSTELELRSMVATTFAYVFVKSRTHDQFFTSLDTIKTQIISNPAIISGFIIKKNIGAEKYNSANLTNRYLPLISQTNTNSPSEITKRLINIADIELACQVLLSLPPLVSPSGVIITNNTPRGPVPITYKYYIKEVDERPLISLQPAFAFSNINKAVEDTIKSLQGQGKYKGGKKLARTHKRKQKKRKTYKKRK
jgi:hypothetical protein